MSRISRPQSHSSTLRKTTIWCVFLASYTIEELVSVLLFMGKATSECCELSLKKHIRRPRSRGNNCKIAARNRGLPIKRVWMLRQWQFYHYWVAILHYISQWKRCCCCTSHWLWQAVSTSAHQVVTHNKCCPLHNEEALRCCSTVFSQIIFLYLPLNFETVHLFCHVFGIKLPIMDYFPFFAPHS